MTLFDCIQTNASWGPGGPHEKWLVQRALVGPDTIEEGSVFDEFDTTHPSLADFVRPKLRALQTLNASALDSPVGTTKAGDWTVEFGVTGSIERQAHKYVVEEEGYCRVSGSLWSVDQVLREVAPVFELLFSLSTGRYCPPSRLGLRQRSDEHRYTLLGPHALAEVRPKQPQLLFALRDHPDMGLLITQLRSLLTLKSSFVSRFLGQRRSPPRFIDDWLRSTIQELALFWADDADEPPSEWHAAPKALIELPARLSRELETGLAEALRIPVDTPERVVALYRSVSFGTRQSVRGRDYLSLNQELNTVLHHALLRFLGFEPEFCVKALAGRWPSLRHVP